ncbi:MAG: DUF6121 family protein [Microbacteriaceae bacterium]
MAEYRKYAIIVAVFAAVLYAAGLIAGLGLISLYTDTDVIREADAGPLIGPMMTIVAVVGTALLLVAIGITVPPDRVRINPAWALGIGLVIYLVYMASGGILYAAGAGRPLGFIEFIEQRLLSPYSLVAGALAFAITIVYQLVLVGRFRERGRPRWPWEHDQ